MTVGMAAGTLAVATVSLVVFRGATGAYADVVMGWGRADLIYGFKQPVREFDTAGNHTLVHERQGWLIASRIGARGVDHVHCAPQPAGNPCPPVLGVAGGASEQDVWRRLGAPTRVRYDGGDKILDFDGVGLTIRLRQFQVSEIEVRPMNGGFAGFLGRWLRIALP